MKPSTKLSRLPTLPVWLTAHRELRVWQRLLAEHLGRLTLQAPVSDLWLRIAAFALLVLAFASQRLRMPKADGQVYRKGSAG